MIRAAEDADWSLDRAYGGAELHAGGVEVPEARELRAWDIARHARNARDRMRALIPEMEAYVARAEGVEAAARVLVRERREAGVARDEDARLDALEDALRSPSEPETPPEPASPELRACE